MVLTTPEAFMITGRNPIVRLRFSNGMELRCTPGHRIFTTNRGYVEAGELTAGRRRPLARPAGAGGQRRLDDPGRAPTSTYYRGKGERRRTCGVCPRCGPMSSPTTSAG